MYVPVTAINTARRSHVKPLWIMFGELLCLNCRGITEKRASMGKLRIEEMAHAYIGNAGCSKPVRRKIRQMNPNGKGRFPRAYSLFLAVITDKQSFLSHRTQELKIALQKWK